jgi:uncharacterized protein YcfJ
MSGKPIEAPIEAPPAYAEVLEVVPATQLVSVPREVCEDVAVTHQPEPRDKHRIIGTATGAVIGGILGNQVGGGSGKKIATVAGTVAGAYAGNKTQERIQAKDAYSTTEQRCTTMTETVENIVGYDVTYRIGEKQGEVRMAQDPGERLPLVNGEIASS